MLLPPLCSIFNVAQESYLSLLSLLAHFKSLPFPSNTFPITFRGNFSLWLHWENKCNETLRLTLLPKICFGQLQTYYHMDSYFLFFLFKTDSCNEAFFQIYTLLSPFYIMSFLKARIYDLKYLDLTQCLAHRW